MQISATNQDGFQVLDSNCPDSATLIQFIDETGRQRDFEWADGVWQLKGDSLFAPWHDP